MQRVAKSLFGLCLTLSVAARGQDPSSLSQAEDRPQNQAPPKAGQSTAPDPEPLPVDKPAAKPETGATNKVKQQPAAKSTRNSPQRKRRGRGRKQADGVPAGGETKRIVIRRGGVNEPVTQIIPGMGAEESNRARQETQDLLVAADSDLKKLGSRTLNSAQQGTVSQIQHYLSVARSALNEGDIQRAHTLARKAQLLSEDLVKH